MAFGSASAVFSQFVYHPLLEGTTTSATGYTGLSGSDVINVALFGNTGTPDKDAAMASTGFNTGQWTTTNEVTDATNWVSGGRALASKTLTHVTNGAMFDAADLAGAGNVTITNAYGCMVYDNTISGGTVAKQGICFNAFGSAQSVTAGTFTVIWSASGVLQITV